ncbi:CIA30 family protein [Planktotalea arctica]|uniref:CIA30 family protein n=1 Tax=Planktotalea arctica TaxID=1481893 RepID=UPI000A174B37|nr:CIA30 family protein [Planktotalea arctica]
MLLIPFRRLILIVALIFPADTYAEDAMLQLSLSDQSRWAYVSDQVMGGVSQGAASFEVVDGQPALRLTGDVSTANRGGFIQARTNLDPSLPETAQGVILNVRGNDQTYFVHLKTNGTLLPWQYYQAPFEVSQNWTEVRIPFCDFAASGRLLRKTPNPTAVRSLAVVAFGRDHSADLTVRSLGFY